MVTGLPSLGTNTVVGRRPGESRDGSERSPMSPVKIGVLLALLALLVVVGLLAWPHGDEPVAFANGDAPASAPQR
ncbi:MAG: hypothetical protein H6825_15400 [Planctomycetes bacterium]|nr:hypothetical protein [Planctomycetota bacterium]